MWEEAGWSNHLITGILWRASCFLRRNFLWDSEMLKDECSLSNTSYWRTTSQFPCFHQRIDHVGYLRDFLMELLLLLFLFLGICLLKWHVHPCYKRKNCRHCKHNVDWRGFDFRIFLTVYWKLDSPHRVLWRSNYMGLKHLLLLVQVSPSRK